LILLSSFFSLFFPSENDLFFLLLFVSTIVEKEIPEEYKTLQDFDPVQPLQNHPATMLSPMREAAVKRQFPLISKRRSTNA